MPRTYSKETYISFLEAAGIAWYLAARFFRHASGPWSTWPLLAVLVIGGAPLLFDLLRKTVRREFGSDLLAGMSIVVSVILDEYLAGAIVALMLSGGTALEQYATRRASSVLGALAKRMPRNAHRKSATGIQDVDLDEIVAGDSVVVFPHETCPVDGVVTEGRGAMDESYLTGEPYRISKVAGAEVLSGAINGESALTIRASRTPVDSRYAKIMRVMREAEINRPHIRRVADRLGSWYTVFALGIAVAGWALGGHASRFLAVLVIATPCPLLLAIPVAIMGAISVAASRGILIRDPGVLERIDTCRTMIFDKTGTLTYGRPMLTEVTCANGIPASESLRLAASLERYSKHPLATAMLDAARRERLDLATVTEIGENPGAGLTGRIGARMVQITGRAAVPAEFLPPARPGMECVLLVDRVYTACFHFRDTPRSDSRSFIRHLAPKHEVNRIILLSGDREEEVQSLAGEVGISEMHFGKSPEEKLEIVRAESRRAPSIFLGDGINDAPAMQAATVGIAFGQNSDITAEAAGAVVLDASLGKVDELLHIGRRMRTIALQSAVGGMALSVAGMLLAAAGYLPPVAGAVAQEIIDAAAVLNALRVAAPGGPLRDDEMRGV